MDMDPTAPAFQRLANNVFAFTAFKSTEPYLEEYAALNVQEVARRAGFSEVDTRQGPPSIRTTITRLNSSILSSTTNEKHVLPSGKP